MVKLSIIIVNYNVKHFIEQCLISVFNAINNIDAKVFVVDNNSVDGSCVMIKDKFPQVKLIENKKYKIFEIIIKDRLCHTGTCYNFPDIGTGVTLFGK